MIEGDEGEALIKYLKSSKDLNDTIKIALEIISNHIFDLNKRVLILENEKNEKKERHV